MLLVPTDATFAKKKKHKKLGNVKVIVKKVFFRKWLFVTKKVNFWRRFIKYKKNVLILRCTKTI